MTEADAAERLARRAALFGTASGRHRAVQPIPRHQPDAAAPNSPDELAIAAAVRAADRTVLQSGSVAQVERQVLAILAASTQRTIAELRNWRAVQGRQPCHRQHERGFRLSDRCAGAWATGMDSTARQLRSAGLRERAFGRQADSPPASGGGGGVIAFPPFDSLEAAWLGVLEAAEATRDGRLLHAVLSITDPAAPVPEVVAANDALLLPRGDHTVDTVANTVFPANLYAPPELDYLPDLQPAEIQLLDAAADDLYSSYRDMLPELCGFDGNERGTYFGRLVSWPGKTSDGYNQLKRRVRQLRSHRDRGHSATNAADFVLEGVAEIESATIEAAGLQMYKSDDERQMAFPCLVHVDLSVVGNRLSLMAVYRHWHLVHKAYGNLVGLTRLLHFLSQQTGYEPGELMIHATVANAEVGTFSHTVLKELIAQVQTQLKDDQEVI